MLFVSLILSAILLLIANGIAWGVRPTGALVVCFSLAVLIVPFFIGCLLPAVMLQSFLLCFAAIVWRISHRGPSAFLPLSCGATLIAYGASGLLVLQTEREYGRLRALYPYESMEGRITATKPGPRGGSLPVATEQRLSRLEADLVGHGYGHQDYQLKRLHEDAVGLFINSPGFGVQRMSYPSESSLAWRLRKEPVPPQPGSRFTSVWSPGEFESPPVADEAPLDRMLDASVRDFVNPGGFGYFKDRRHVAGFQSHQFSQVPEPANRWKVQTLELVSLLMNDEPVVYFSPDLPRMDRLRGVPTRPLDRFERFGLNALRQGEDLSIVQGEEGLRMLGAVRSINQCVSCHGGTRGDLLGAFSYNLRSD